MEARERKTSSSKSKTTTRSLSESLDEAMASLELNLTEKKDSSKNVKISSAPSNVPKNPRWVKLAQKLGLTDKQAVTYDYLISINPKVYRQRFGTEALPDLDKIKVPARFQTRSMDDVKSPPSRPVLSEKEKVKQKRMNKIFDMSEDEFVSYEYLQSIEPKVFEKNFGSRPSMESFKAPSRYRRSGRRDRAPSVGVLSRSSNVPERSCSQQR